MLSDLAIKRPVLATVVSALILVVGLAGLFQLPVRELPDVDRATVTITTTYPGAAPEVIDAEVVEPVESAISGIDGISRISSQSRIGRGQTRVEFIPERDLDEAANDVRDAVGRVQGSLPGDANQPQVVKADADAQPIIRLSVTSDSMSPAEVTDYAERFIVDQLATLEGVAEIQSFGQRRFAMRLWLDRRAMAARNLTVDDVEQALRRNNVELPAGEIQSVDRQFTVRTESRLAAVEDFERLIISRTNGYPIRLADIARVELGVEDDSSIVRSDGGFAIGLGVQRQAQANTIAVSSAVRDQIERLRPTLPDGMEVTVSSDDAIFINQSIEEVLKALGFAVILVILVIFIFLRSPRATLVPAVTIPVALIGSLAVIAALGFSINVLTLLALILAIGLVVDDAIVMLENIQRRVEAGEKPLSASYLGARQVTFAILATSATLIAVFVPISFLEGNVGRLFQEFGFVLASAVVISTFVALTLCPMLCSKVLSARDPENTTRSRFDRAFDGLAGGYKKALATALNMPIVVIFLAIVVSIGGVYLYQTLPEELTPSEDRGVIIIPVTSPQGATTAYTDRYVREIEGILEPLYESGEIERIFSIVGFGNRPERAFMIAALADWSERDRSQQEIARSLIPQITQVTGVNAFPVSPSGLGVRGAGQPLRFEVGGPNYEVIEEWADTMTAALEENPRLQNIDMDFERTRPQLDVNIDRERADDLGVTVEQIGRTLQTFLASREVTNFVNRGREYPVILQGLDDDRRSPSDLQNLFVRPNNGQVTLTPLSALVDLREMAAAPALTRSDRLPSISITGELTEGYDLGTAIQFVRATAAETLPDEARITFSGLSQEFLDASGGLFVVFGLALLVVFLVLAAQFESFIHPLIIMLSVPLAITGALLALLLTDTSLNIYSQIGAVLLIGLMAKNGILIVEFANQLRDEGYSVRDAILEGSAIRFRPILMTVVSTVLGATPLVLSTGAGAESRMAIGIVIMGGLGGATLLTLFLTPVLFDLLARFTTPRNAVAQALEAEMQGTKTTGHHPPAKTSA